MSAVSTTDARLTGPWTYLPLHSTVSFAVPYVVIDFRATFGEVTAELDDGTLSGTASVASVDIADDSLRTSVLGPDFFDAATFPELSFRSTTLALAGDRVTLEGEMTLRGVTRPLRATGSVAGPRQDFMGYTRIGFELSATIDRTEYGLGWNAELPAGGDALSNSVLITALLEFARPADAA